MLTVIRTEGCLISDPARNYYCFHTILPLMQGKIDKPNDAVMQPPLIEQLLDGIGEIRWKDGCFAARRDRRKLQRTV